MAALIFAGCGGPPESEVASFREVVDGRNVEVIIEGKIHKVQLCGVKPTESTAAAIEEMVATNDEIYVLRTGDLAEIFVPTDSEEEIHVNSELLLRGKAELDEGEVDRCPNGNVMRSAVP
ncbi:MAG: hypothetical protein AAGA67_08520 [Cyanobacteria bacterium P01_F01_bin.153]